MPGWFRRAATRASRAARAGTGPSPSLGMTLTATSRSSFSSQAPVDDAEAAGAELALQAVAVEHQRRRRGSRRGRGRGSSGSRPSAEVASCDGGSYGSCGVGSSGPRSGRGRALGAASAAPAHSPPAAPTARPAPARRALVEHARARLVVGVVGASRGVPSQLGRFCSRAREPSVRRREGSRYRPVEPSYFPISSQAASTREAIFRVLPRRKRRPTQARRRSPGASPAHGSHRSQPADAAPRHRHRRRRGADLFLLFLAVKSCRGAAKEQAFKDYNRDVGAFVQESEDQSKGLFDLLENGGQSPVELQNTVNGYASEAAQLVDRAKDTDHPGELDSAHRYLVETLEFRRDGLKGIADQLPRALGDRGEEATAEHRRADAELPDQRRHLLAALLPAARGGAARTRACSTPRSRPRAVPAPTSSGSCPATVADRIGRIGSGEGGRVERPGRPGLHGTGLGTVTVQPGGRRSTRAAPPRSRPRRTSRWTCRSPTRARTTRRT